ncbi:MAG: hypothetical protein LR011_04300 [Verrucomicrobia bacterium]|nr:hypothetical protein [Verrucomicrobiota bacterium]
MRIHLYLILSVAIVLIGCGKNEQVESNQAITNLETVFDSEPPASPDRPAPPPAARKKLQEQVKAAANFMKEEKYEEAMGVLNNVRRSEFISAEEKPAIDDAMRRSQKSLARLKAQGGLSEAEEARIRQQLSR